MSKTTNNNNRVIFTLSQHAFLSISSQVDRFQQVCFYLVHFFTCLLWPLVFGIYSPHLYSYLVSGGCFSRIKSTPSAEPVVIRMWETVATCTDTELIMVLIVLVSFRHSEQTRFLSEKAEGNETTEATRSVGNFMFVFRGDIMLAHKVQSYVLLKELQISHSNIYYVYIR